MHVGSATVFSESIGCVHLPKGALTVRVSVLTSHSTCSRQVGSSYRAYVHAGANYERAWRAWEVAEAPACPDRHVAWRRTLLLSEKIHCLTASSDFPPGSLSCVLSFKPRTAGSRIPTSSGPNLQAMTGHAASSLVRLLALFWSSAAAAENRLEPRLAAEGENSELRNRAAQAMEDGGEGAQSAGMASST